MRVLYFIACQVIGGAETQLQYLIKYLPKHITPIVVYQYPELEQFVKAMKVEHQRVHSPATLAKFIDSANIDIVQAYHSLDAYNAMGRLQKKTKFVEVVHNQYWFPGDSTGYPKDRTTAIVCVSNSAFHYFRSNYPDMDANIIPNGLDPELFRPAGRALPRTSPRTGGFTGRLEAGPAKGVPQLIEIMSKLPINFEFVGKDYGDHRRTCESKGFTNISFIDHVSNVQDYYNKWDFFASMSVAEGYGLSIAEAAACGIPTYVYQCGGVCDLIKGEGNVFIVDSAEAMANAIMTHTVKGKPVLRQSELIQLSARTMANSYAALYDKLMAESPTVTRPYATQRSVNNNEPSTAQFYDTRGVLRERKELNKQVVLGITNAERSGIRRSLESYTTHFCTPDEAIQTIRQLMPSVVVFGGVIAGWDKTLYLARQLGCTIVVTWHGTYTLNEFDHETRVMMKEALAYYKKGLIDYLAVPHEGLAKVWTHFGYPTDYLPNVLTNPPQVRKSSLSGIHIGVFGTGLPWKNMEAQIIGAAMVPGATVHTQNLKFKDSLESLGISVVEHPHLSQEAFQELLGQMTVNLCCTTTETYSYLIAESLFSGTPVIASANIPMMFDAAEYDVWLRAMVCANFDDPFEIASCIKKLNYELTGQVGRDFITLYNENNKEIASKVINKWRSK